MAFHQYSPLFTSGLLSDVLHSPPRKTPHELRSFLFLDLADVNAQSMSLKRNDSNATCSTWNGRRIASAHPDPNIYLAIPPSPAPSSRRPSRENLRQLPSPKPAPSSNLPDIPTPPPNAHRLSTFSQTSSAKSESVKSEVKRSNRSAALACLEGRSKSANNVSKRQNFMSMSDDEDECDPIIIIEDAPKPPLESNRTSRSSSTAAIKSLRKRSRTIDSWLPPLTNFLDFKEDDVSSWRSFIEISRA